MIIDFKQAIEFAKAKDLDMLCLLQLYVLFTK